MNLLISSSNLSPISDSESDDELTNMTQGRERKHVDSREDTTSDEITSLFHQDRGSRALQENARMRNNGHFRTSSPHRPPLQVTQEQASSPRPFKRIRDKDSETAYTPKKQKVSSTVCRKIKANEQNIKVQKPEKCVSEPPVLVLAQTKIPPKQLEIVDREPPYLDLSCESSDELPSVLTPSKEPQKKDVEISKKNRDISRSRTSAFSTPKKCDVLLSTESHRQSTDVLRTSGGVLNKHRHQDEHRTSVNSSSRSAFDFLQNLSQSDSSDFETSSRHIVGSKTKELPKEISHLPNSTPCPPKVTPHVPNTTPCPPKEEEQAPEINREVYVSCVPVHMKAPEMCNKEKPVAESDILTFGNLIETLLEGCQEEGQHSDAVDFIQGFTSTHRCPSNDVLAYMLEDILLKAVNSEALLCSTYTTLKHVQHIHPPSRFKFLLNWGMIKTVVNNLLADGARQESDSEVRLIGQYLVLQYITSLLADDLETQNRNATLNFSYVFGLLSPDNPSSCKENLRNITSWICQCAIRIQEAELQIQRTGNVSPTPPAPPTRQKMTCHKKLSFLSISPTENESPESAPSWQTRLTILLKVLEMLQKLLHMCLVASINLSQSASTVAYILRDYYKELPGYEHRRRVLQVSGSQRSGFLLQNIHSNNMFQGTEVIWGITINTPYIITL